MSQTRNVEEIRPVGHPSPIPREFLESTASWLLLAPAVLFAAFETIAIYSAIIGKPSQSAFAGAIVLAAVVGLVYFMLPKVGRRRALARAALTASALAPMLALALSGKIAEAQGALPPVASIVQTLLLLLFQAGWAVTYWLTVGRGLESQTRFVPAALGGVLLVLGGFMSGLGTQVERPAASEAAAEKFTTFPKPEELAFARETERAGNGERGSDFAHYHTGSLPLLGITVSTRDWMRRQRVDSDLRGIFDRNATAGGGHVLLAEPGFAVSGVEVQGSKHIDAIRVEFAPLVDSRVSYADRYWSDWVGSYRLSEATSHLDGDSNLVVGVSGSKGMVLDSLSLLVAK